MSEKFYNSQTKNMFLMFFFTKILYDWFQICVDIVFLVYIGFHRCPSIKLKIFLSSKMIFLKRSLNFLLETQNVFWIYLNSKHDKIWGKMSKKRWKDCFCLHPIIRFSYCLTNRWRFLFKTVSISTRSKLNG